MIIKVCPKCGSTVFQASAHVVQTWRLDEFGHFIDVAEDATDITHEPDDDDVWNCNSCGYDAAGKEFNVNVPDGYTSEHDTDADGKYIGWQNLQR